MTQHERAVMIMAIDFGRPVGMAWNSEHEKVAERVWEAARKYEPPAVCGAINEGAPLWRCNRYGCRDGDHRYTFGDRSYFGWPRA